MRGNTFLHPRLGISFSVPPGFVIDNSAAAVTATGPGDMAIRFDGVALDQRTQLADYLRSGWVAGLEPSSVRDATINGNEAATARPRADGWQFDITVIRAGGQVYRLLTAAPAGQRPRSTPSRVPVGGSFKLLSRAREGGAEAAAGPRRHRASPARTIGSLSATHGRRRPQARTVPGAQRAVARRDAFRPATRSRSSPTAERRRSGRSSQKCRTARLTSADLQLFQRAAFDLAHALLGNAERLAEHFQRRARPRAGAALR